MFLLTSLVPQIPKSWYQICVSHFVFVFQALKVSDHYPVEVELKSLTQDEDGKFTQRPVKLLLPSKPWYVTINLLTVCAC